MALSSPLVQARQYDERMTPYVFFTCLIASTGGLMFGYDIGFSGGVTSMDPFLLKFFPSVYHKMKEDSQYCAFNTTLTLFRSSLYLAALVASFFASWMTSKFGRRISMLMGGAVFLAGAAINGAANHVAMLIIGRVFLGVGIGFANQSVPLYLSEMAPANYRGVLNGFFHLMIAIGISAASLINYYGRGWRVSLTGAVVPAAVFTIGSLFLPDTPNSLIERHLDNPDRAQAILRHIHGIDDVEEEYNDLLAASVRSNKIDRSWSNILNRRYRPQLVMAVLIPLFQQLTGINFIMFYATELLRTMGLEKNASLETYAAMNTVNNVGATLLYIFKVDNYYYGRRRLFLEGGVGMLISYIVLGVGQSDKVIYAIVVTFAYSWGPLGWLVPSEIFPLEIRSAGQSINVSVNMLFTFLISLVFPNMFCHMKFEIFYFFAFWVLCMTVFACFFLPETKSVPIEQVFQLWKRHWFWGKFIPDDAN